MYLKRIMSEIPEHLLLYYNVSQEKFQNIYYCTTMYLKRNSRTFTNVSQDNIVQNSRTFIIILQRISREYCPKYQNIYCHATMYLNRIMSKIPEYLLLFYHVSQEINV